MQQTLPIKFHELLQLPRVGINQASIAFPTLTMESEKYICVREQVGDAKSVVVVDMANPSNPVRRPAAAEMAMMNPAKNILALNNDRLLQVYDVQEKTRIGEYQMPQPVVFWKWLNASVIGIVTGTSVYHWDIKTPEPVKAFDRLPNLADCQIINYRSDRSMQWFALVGITQKEGMVVGAAQLYSVEKKASQFLEAHACAFAEYKVEGASKPCTLFIFAQKNATSSKLFILEVIKGDESKPFSRTAVDVAFPSDSATDFPVAIQVSEKFDIIYLVTKLGFLFLYYIGNGTLIYVNRISSDPIFLTAPHDSTSGILCINRRGQVLSVSVDESTIVNHISNTLRDIPLARRIATRNHLGGADSLFLEEFNHFLASSMWKEAAGIAAQPPGTCIRNAQTLARLQQIAPVGGLSPLLQYLAAMMETVKLNQVETLELAKLVIQQNKVPLLAQWIEAGKIECSEQLGDEVRRFDLRVALSVYHEAKIHHKVVQIMAETQQYQKIIEYATAVTYKPDYMQLLTMIIPVNPTGARTFAASLLQQGGDLVDINGVVDAFLKYKLIQDVTSLLLDVLKDKPEEGPLQTKLLEINLINAPSVADAILGHEMFTQYDRKRVAQLCEQAGLFQRALQHYTEIADIRRVIVNTHVIPAEFLVKYFATLSAEDTLEILPDLLRLNMRQNLPIVVQIAITYHEQLTPAKLIKVFEQFKSFEGIFYFLNQIVNTSTDAEVHYKYIEAAARTGQFAEVERVCRESDVYEAARVRDLLKELKLQDQLPFIIVCDRYDFVDDMTRYLYVNSLNKFIEAYVSKINPQKTPTVVGALLDAGCSEEYVKNLVLMTHGLCPVEPLVSAFQDRNRLKLALPWLEERLAQGGKEVALHNAIGKIYVDISKNPEEFLNTNTFYDSLEVGRYCEDRDPYLAFVAYRRGKCDKELVEVTNNHALFKYQARYLVERQDLNLWAAVLDKSNKYQRSVIDQVVQTALPESKSPEEISTTVRAFMNADLPKELIELLDKIVMEGSEFGEHKSLQNLLILTAVGSEPNRVMGYIDRLNNYDSAEVASICINASLFEEAHFIYKKFKNHVSAVEVLLQHLDSIPRAKDYAERVNEPAVWSKLACSQLKKEQPKDAIESFLKANDHEFFADVIEASRKASIYDDLVRYLQMCRKKIKEPKIESELIFAFAKTNKLGDLEEFINSPNCAQIQMVGDRCFDEKLYEAARLLYNNINNFVRLASTLVMLKQYNAAVDAARKANSTKTWKEVNIACVDAHEFRLAQICGLHIIIHGDELTDLVTNYERRGYFEEVIGLLESGLGLERAHTGMFTELAILYSKYKEDKLMEHLKVYSDRINTGKVMRVCTNNQQWKEVTYLCLANEPDKAIETMMEHSADAWDAVTFKDAVVRAKPDLVYKAVEFYLAEQPKKVVDLLQAVVQKVDHTIVVERVRRKDKLPMIRPYLLQVQEQNIAAVNQALNELYVQEGDYDALRKSIMMFNNFDHVALAQDIEKHPQLEFRRISASLFTMNKNYEKALALCKADNTFQDAIRIAAESENQDIAEDLLSFFVNTGNKAAYVACLHTCYPIIRPDVALEKGWRFNLMDYTYPFLIQNYREQTTKVKALETRLNKLEAAMKAREEKDATASGFDRPPVPEQFGAGVGPYGLLGLPMAPSMMTTTTPTALPMAMPPVQPVMGMAGTMTMPMPMQGNVMMPFGTQ